MIVFSKLSEDQVNEVKDKANMFYVTHAKHVEKLASSTENQVAPSGSDLFRPELWKEIHWRWYFSLMSREVPQTKTSWWKKLFS